MNITLWTLQILLALHTLSGAIWKVSNSEQSVPTLAAVEMLVFSGVHLASGATEHGPMMYWLVVAGFCAFIVYGRLVLCPIRSSRPAS